jgi:tyrosyl-tRNA synthetase
MGMSVEEKFELITRNTVEIVTADELKKVLKKKHPVVYCGYEPIGPLHLGHFVTILKLMDLERAGFEVKILLADIHGMLNKKGDEKEMEKEVKFWGKTVKAIGVKAEIVLGSDFQFKKEYQFDVMKLAQGSTINRGLRSMQEIARDVEHATISQLWYPLMQVVDIKFLGVDVALGGMEQRKVHMIGKDMSKVLGYDFVAIHTPLITSLKGPGEKMSSSVQGSNISVVDSYDVIKKTLKGAYCPEKKVEGNPVLEICKLIVIPKLGQLEIKRPEKFGGNIDYLNYDDLERDFAEGKLHPMDLKSGVGEALEEIIAPIRKNFK